MNYQAGPFSALLAPTRVQRHCGESLKEFLVGLLTSPPDPDGEGYCAVPRSACARANVRLDPYSSALDANFHPVTLVLPPGHPVAHVGLFDEFGRLRFYGALSGRKSVSTPPQEFHFLPYGLRVKRVGAGGAGGFTPARTH